MKKLHLGLMVVASIVLLFSFVVLCAYAWNLFNFPFDYDQGEGFELVDTILFSQGQWPYRNTDVYPFYSSNYPPLYHVIAAPFVWIFGDAYWYGRLLSLLSAFIAAVAIYWAVQREGNRWIGILAALAFLSSNTVYHIAPLFRQHIVMVAFETVAVVILARAIPKRETKWIAVGLGLLIAAGYTKQLAAITAGAVFLWFFLQNPRRSILWGLGFGLIGGLIFLAINIATGGEWWRQTIVANINAFDPFQTYYLTMLWLRLHGFLIVPALLLLIYESYFERLSLYSLWFVVAFALGAFSSGKWGGGDSYFSTSIAALCILSGIFLSRLLVGGWKFPESFPKWKTQSLALLLVPLLYLGYGIATLKMPTDGAFFGTIAQVLNIQPNVMGRHYDSAGYIVGGYAYIGHFVTEDDIANGWRIVEAIESTDAPVLSEEAAFSLLAGREVISNPTQLLNLWNAEIERGIELWNGDELVRMLENQEFGLLVFRARFYPTPVLEAVEQYYEISEIIPMNGFDYLLMRPKS
jgi:4-amino-4-deoxy-L-arabinose transferase-like glycosyltransferase